MCAHLEQSHRLKISRRVFARVHIYAHDSQCLPLGPEDMKSSPPPQHRSSRRGTGIISIGIMIRAGLPLSETTHAKISQKITAVKRAATMAILAIGCSAIFVSAARQRIIVWVRGKAALRAVCLALSAGRAYHRQKAPTPTARALGCKQTALVACTHDTLITALAFSSRVFVYSYREAHATRVWRAAPPPLARSRSARCSYGLRRDRLNTRVKPGTV